MFIKALTPLTGIYRRSKSHSFCLNSAEESQVDYNREAAFGKRRLQVLCNLMQNLCCYSRTFGKYFVGSKLVQHQQRSQPSRCKAVHCICSCCLYSFFEFRSQKAIYTKF